MKLYIAVLDEFPDYMTPTLVAHSVLGYHLFVVNNPNTDIMLCESYHSYLANSFKKVVVKVNSKEFEKISALKHVYLGHENKTLDGRKSCAVWLYDTDDDLPNVLKFAKLWKPNSNVA